VVAKHAADDTQVAAVEDLRTRRRLMVHRQALFSFYLTVIPGSPDLVRIGSARLFVQGSRALLGLLAVGFRPGRVFWSQPLPVHRKFVLGLIPVVGSGYQNSAEDRADRRTVEASQSVSQVRGRGSIGSSFRYRWMSPTKSAGSPVQQSSEGTRNRRMGIMSDQDSV
jgi:hypothetical protein